MKLNKVIAIPAVALAAGLGLAACSASAPAPAPTHTVIVLPKITHTVTATPTPAPTTPAPKVIVVTPAPAPAPVVVVPAPAPAAPSGSAVGNCGGGVSAGPNTSCAFARNVMAAYNGPGPDTETVYSPTTGQNYTVTYNSAGGFATGTTATGASVTFVYQSGMG